jgi:uncharacterized membrane protein YhaH (DUF805 family)
MNFIDAVKCGYKYAGDTKGRATRSEFWFFYLYSILVTILSLVLVRLTHKDINSVVGVILFIIYFAFVSIPNITIAIRRLHDINKSGYWLLATFIPILGLGVYVLMCFKSYPKKNIYGPAPKNHEVKRNNDTSYSKWLKNWALTYTLGLVALVIIFFLATKVFETINQNKLKFEQSDDEDTRICLSEQIPATENAIKNISEIIDPFSNINDVKSKIKEKLNMDFQLVIAQDNIKNRVLVATVSTSCKSKFSFLINIRDNENKELTDFSVYAQNSPKGYSVGSNGYIDSLHKNFVNMRLSKIQNANPATINKDTNNSNQQDHCAPNLSRQERIARLAKHGTVRESGLWTFTAGGSRIEFTDSTASSVFTCY